MRGDAPLLDSGSLSADNPVNQCGGEQDGPKLAAQVSITTASISISSCQELHTNHPINTAHGDKFSLSRNPRIGSRS